MRLDEDSQATNAFVCWNIWLGRNGVVWNDKPLEAVAIVASVCHQYSSWKNYDSANVRGVVISRNDGLIRWKAPSLGWLKVNTDAAFFPGRQRIKIGLWFVIVWVILSKLANFGNNSPRLDEIIGIREALSWLKDKDKIILESDAMEVLLEIRNPGCWESELLAKDYVNLAKRFDNINFIFVRRSANQAAHVLAQYASSISGHQKWFCHFSEFSHNCNRFRFDLIESFLSIKIE
ncbi:uncharacterized protein LOC130014820 [Mercurialis annua]|uniref:uncharacterized protein LOC130014820 n=1 Tax=Mercurialis annua TaxID=3986 RepID=UPI0024ACCAC3|nr:uncharacterized protein LOC130014820 [Mercurialis annua]